jgi:hypothetical protein
MSLLSEADDRAIRDAVKLTTDTFMVSPVTYKKSGGALDEWEEDKEAEEFTDINLLALEEYKPEDVKEGLEGNLDLNDVKLTLNVEDLEALDLIEANYKHKFTAEADYFELKGQLYRVTDIYYDGPLSDKPVLLIITGKLSDKVM